MSRRDPGAANGGAVREPGYCNVCGDIESVHRVKPDGKRGACSRSGCGCGQYEPVPACCRCDPKTCADDDMGDHCAEQSCGWCLHGCPAPVGVPCCREEP